MISAPASAWTRACLTRISTVSSLTMTPSRKQPVMAVAGIGIERDIAEDADLRHRLLDRADGAADEIVGIERLGSVLVAQLRVGIGKQREAGDVELGGALGRPHRLLDREPLDARHRGDRRAGVVGHEQRPDQVVHRQHVLAQQAPRPFGLAVAARADGEVEPEFRLGGRRLDRADPRFGLDRSAVFDSH